MSQKTPQKPNLQPCWAANILGLSFSNWLDDNVAMEGNREEGALARVWGQSRKEGKVALG